MLKSRSSCLRSFLLPKKLVTLTSRTYSNVTRILNDGTKATGVIYVDTFTGEEFEQPAEVSGFSELCI